MFISARKNFSYLLLALLVAGGVLFHVPIEKFFLNSKGQLTDFAKSSIDQTIADVDATVSAPPPLRSEKESPNPLITQAGTIKWTNINRNENGLPALEENEKLDAAAAEKAKDILEKQYFDHVSPSGKSPQDLVEEAGYTYISTGENLAMGNFANDQELLDAWMASPGHRENILQKGFREIGVAVLLGEYEGKKTWVAVQEFGTSLSDCPAVDSKLKKTIKENSAKITSLADTLQSEKDKISELRSKDPTLSGKIDEFNALVKEYNALVAKTKKQIETYNGQVSSFNSCIKKIKN
jgi:uncharacterized protein YkwD